MVFIFINHSTCGLCGLLYYTFTADFPGLNNYDTLQVVRFISVFGLSEVKKVQ